MNHISLETAKRIHQIGFTKETCFMWGRYYEWRLLEEEDSVKQYDEEYSVEYTENLPDHVYFEEEFPCPTCEELLEALPVEFPQDKDYSLVLWKQLEGKYSACFDKFGAEEACMYAQGDSPAEALALLLIELVEEGIVSKEDLSDKQ